MRKDNPGRMKRMVVAGIGTEIGKTFISAILVEALQADYWKPVQAGNLEDTDTDFVRRHISNDISVFHPEGYRLTAAMSPHAAAEAEGISIDLDQLSIPQTERTLVIELAGGLMVPLNKQQLNIDLLKRWQLPVILVSRNYLGSINHTLLSIEVLKQQGIPVPALIFNGEPNPATEEIIMHYTGIPCLFRVSQQREISQKLVKELAEGIKDQLKQYI